MTRALTLSASFVEQVQSGSAAYDWANTDKHGGRLSVARTELENNRSSQEKDLMILSTADIKKQYTAVDLLSLIESFCKHDMEVEGLQALTIRMLEHHKLEAPNSRPSA